MISREEAKDMIYAQGSEHGTGYSALVKAIKFIVNKIYDDFDSRTCGNCSVMNCQILNAVADMGTIRLVDFGCNKWEGKSDDKKRMDKG